MTKASLLMTARHPIILDGNNAAVILLVQHTHEINCHCGPEQTRSTLMEYYWILRCRAVVKQTICHSLRCRRMLQDISTPQMADLPEERSPNKNQFVFETTGFDFIGPFPVKNNGRLSSRYILLFTCLVVRAVHLGFQMISKQTLQSTASGVLLAAEENPTNSSQIVASLLLVQTTLCNLASQNWKNQNFLQLSYI